MAEDESGSKGQSKGLPFLYLLTHFEMGNGRSIAVARDVLFDLVQYGRLNNSGLPWVGHSLITA